MNRIKLVLLTLFLIFPISNISLAKDRDQNAEEFYQADQAFEARDYAKAEQIYRSSLVKYKNMKPIAAYIENQIAKCQRYQGKPDAAVAQYQKVQTAYPESPQAAQVQENVARTYYEARNYEKAGPEFEKLANECETKENQAGKAQAAGVGGAGAKPAEYSEKRQNALMAAAYSYKTSGHGIKAAIVSGHWADLFKLKKKGEK